MARLQLYIKNVYVHADRDWLGQGEMKMDAIVPGFSELVDLRFDDVRLKKGERTLVATADAKNAVAESDEGNNELTVAAKCKADD